MLILTARRTASILTILYFFAFPGIAYTQSSSAGFEHISVEQGLSQSYVSCILQDSRGYMWFGTQDGLNRFDGYTFTIYKHDPFDSTSLSENYIQRILEDRNGVLWVGTYGGGLNKFDAKTETFVRYKHDPDNPGSLSHNEIFAMCEDREGALWIGTNGGGLSKLVRRADSTGKGSGLPTGTFINYLHDPNDPNSLGNNRVWSIFEDRTGALWIATSNGLDKLVLPSRAGQPREADSRHIAPSASFIHYRHDPNDPNSLQNNLVWRIYEDHEGMLWLGIWRKGLNRFDPKTETFRFYRHDPATPNSLSHNNVLAIYEDRQGTLWLGTEGGGLNRFDRKTESFFHYKRDKNDRNGLNDNIVNSIYESREGALWIGTYSGGINKYSRRKERFKRYGHLPNQPNSLSDAYVGAIFEDRSGALWIGTNGGLNRLDRKTGDFSHYKHDPNNPGSLSHDLVTALYEDKSGALWIGTLKGLNRFDRKTATFTRYLNDPGDPQSLSFNYILAISEDRAGALWIGTHGGGLNRMRRNDAQPNRKQTIEFSRYQHDPQNPHSLSHNSVQAIYEDRAGMLWLGTYGGGLCRVNPGALRAGQEESARFTRYQHDPQDPQSLSDNDVLAIHEDETGVLWLGTLGGGLCKLARDSLGKEIFTRYTVKDGLPNDAVFGILPDDAGNLWLSTNNGLSQFSLRRSRSSAGAIEPGKSLFRNFDTDDGLQSTEFNFGAHHKNARGEMFFGGINGINVFHPDSIKNNPAIPPIVITAVMKYDKPLKAAAYQDRLLKLSYQDKFISFEFAALDYTSPAKNKYAYKLEGFDDDWIYCGARRFASYTNLNPGSYVFRVKGTNNDGVWNEEGAAIRFIIVPPFWKTNWFMALSLAALVFSVIAIHRYRVSQKIKQFLEMERVRNAERERVREQVSRDYHDELGHQLTKISLYTELIKRNFRDNATETRTFLDKVLTAAEKLSRDARDFIWTLHPEKDTLYDLALYVKEIGDSLFEKTEIKFQFDAPLEEFKKIGLPMDWRRQLTFIMKEGMNNILKHAGCRNVELQFLAGDGHLHITLRDDGAGFDTKDRPARNGSGNGLANMQARTKQIHAQLTIESSPGKGTTIRFSGKLPTIGYL